MAKILSSAYLNKKLSGDQLRSKVGNVQINSGSMSKVLGGTGLKKFITKMGGKTDTQIEKILKDKYGVSGYQIKKRESIMKLIRGDKKNGLAEEQIKRNLKFDMQKDESGVRNKQMYNIKYAGGAVRTKGMKEDINVGKGIKTGFAQAYKSDKLPDNPASKASLSGTRPIGFI